MPRLAIEKWEAEHRKHIRSFLAEIDALYDETIDELVRLGVVYDYNPDAGKLFTFSSDGVRQKEAKGIIDTFRTKLNAIITVGISTEWAFANAKNDEWVRALFSNPKEGYMLHNLKALDAFQNRKVYGHKLSDRVWQYTKQFEEFMEMSLSVSISEGRNAASISRDVRSQLKYPDKLFRRVRDRFGNLVLSKRAHSFHPGQGVYRSSYQNAMRMARTEINGAYRQSDHERWQQLDFIVGVEVKPSKTHQAWLAKEWYPRFKKGVVPPMEICDAMKGRYPKDFKFIGWHPNCKCYAVPVIANEGTEKDFWDEPENEVTETPALFDKWLLDNNDRINEAIKRGKAPYWVVENPQYAKIVGK
jgi:hypothetical protein